MMPPLPPLLSVSLHDPFKEIRDYALAYGRAVAEACAVVCEDLANALDRQKQDPMTCAAAIREMAKEENNVRP